MLARLRAKNLLNHLFRQRARSRDALRYVVESWAFAASSFCVLFSDVTKQWKSRIRLAHHVTPRVWGSTCDHSLHASQLLPKNDAPAQHADPRHLRHLPDLQPTRSSSVLYPVGRPLPADIIVSALAQHKRWASGCQRGGSQTCAGAQTRYGG